MTPSARLSAAMEVLSDIFNRRRPAPDALKDWGLAHRFAGSSDRAAIASLVYDGLRRKASASWIMGDETPRAIILGMLALQRGQTLENLEALCAPDTRFAPEPLTPDECTRLNAPSLKKASLPVQGDFPKWLKGTIEKAFGSNALQEMQALIQRAPLDIRVNALKTTREEVATALAHHNPVPTPFSTLGLRFTIGEDGRGPSLQSEERFQLGDYEIQDEGSQLTVALSGVKEGQRVVDLCAGAGGKTLALGVAMKNTGEILASDVDTRRLAPLHQRVQRAGITNVSVRAPKNRDDDALIDMRGKADLVFVDAPCTGSGTWRRNPDAKWRLTINSLNDRVKDQATVLARGARLVKKGGCLIYVTCSILPEENDQSLKAFLATHGHFEVVSMEPQAKALGLPVEKLKTPLGGLQFTPHRTQTDGFYMVMCERVS
jgi:16S rRNA (cytosine967-C5)-methyltransferase